MDPKTLSEVLGKITEQGWINGIKAGLAVVACVFLYLETQAHTVTPSLRKRILSRVPLVVGIVGLALLGLHEVAPRYKGLAGFQDAAVPTFVLFAIAAGLFAYGVHQIQAGHLLPRAKQIIGSALAAVAILLFFLFYHLSYKGYYHRWEFFHYYMGSKYAQELSYKRLYICSAIADAETGNEKAVKRRKMRDLSETNLLIPSKPLLDTPEVCKSHFSEARWEAFKNDVRFFRAKAGTGYWNDMQKDHGYNPPPIWTIAGHYLSELSPATDAFFKLMAAIDVTMTALLFIAIGWAFGWRVLIISLLFWGTQEPAPFYWTGGAFLRQDWFFLSVIAACLLRKRYYFWAGVALTYAAGLRVFPVLLWAGPLVIIAADFIRRRRLQGPHLRLLAGGVVAAALLLPLSVHVTGGTQAWKDFAHHISVHQGTPLTNHVGLKTLVATEPGNRMKYGRDNRLLDPFERWKARRTERFRSLQPLHYGIIAVFGAGLVYTLLRVRSLWVGMGLSLIFVVSVVEATCYYYSIWVLAAILTKVKRKMEWPLLAVFLGLLAFILYRVLAARLGVTDIIAIALAVGAVGLLYYYYHESLHEFARTDGSMDIAVIGLGGASQVLTVQFYFIDDKFVSISALYVFWTLAFLVAFARRPTALVAIEPAPVRSSP